MDTSQKYFLTVVEEMNISRAARRLYISQQCLSRHIKALEERYGTVLFNRSPRLSLTPSGEHMYETLQYMQALENSLYNDLDDSSNLCRGRLRVALPQSRFILTMPPILKEFHELYPNVTVEVVGSQTVKSEDRLMKGEIDLYLGFDTKPNPLFEIIPVYEDQIRLTGTEEIFCNYVKDFKERLPQLRNGIALEEVIDAPFITIDSTSAMMQSIHRHLKNNNINLNVILESPDAELNLVMIGTGYALGFCGAMHFTMVPAINVFGDPQAVIYSLPIKGYSYISQASLVSHKLTWKPHYMKDFIKIFTDRYRNYHELISLYTGSVNNKNI